MAGGKTGSKSVPKADFEAIEAAVMETARGRWFLAEYARRNRAADTAAVLEVLARLEAKLAATQQPTAAAVPSGRVDPPVPRAPVQQEGPPAKREPPRIPEPDFSAVEQLFRSSAPARPPPSEATASGDLDDEPWPPEADDPPVANASSDADPEEDPEVVEEDIEAWEAELNEIDPPTGEPVPEPPAEFSFFRRIETRGATALAPDARPVIDPPRPVIDPPRPVIDPPRPVIDPPRPVVDPLRPVFDLARPIVEPAQAAFEPPPPAPVAAGDWPAPRRLEPRSVFPKPEPTRTLVADVRRPEPSPPAPPRQEFVQSQAVPSTEPAARATSTLLERLEPSRPASPPPAAAARPARRPTPRVDDPTVTMTRDEKLAMFS